MKNILKITGMLLVGISMLNAAECSSEKKAQMIMNGVEQSVIDKMCSPKADNVAQQPVQVIINNSSSADNTNTNTNTGTNTVDATSGYNDYAKTDSIKRDRMYIAVSAMSGSGESIVDDEYYSNISGSTTSFALGYVFDSNNRFEIASSIVEVDEWDSTTIEGVDFNWIWTMGSKEVQSGNMRPYLLFGFGNYTITNGDWTADAVGVNLGLGIMYPLGESFEIDLGYHVKSLAWDQAIYDNYTTTEYSVTRSIDLSGLNLLLRLKF